MILVGHKAHENCDSPVFGSCSKSRNTKNLLVYPSIELYSETKQAKLAQVAARIGQNRSHLVQTRPKIATDGLMTIRNGCIWQVPCQYAQGLAGFGGGDLHHQSLEKHKFVLQDWDGTAAMEKEACIIFPHAPFSAIFEASSKLPASVAGRAKCPSKHLNCKERNLEILGTC